MKRIVVPETAEGLLAILTAIYPSFQPLAEDDPFLEAAGDGLAYHAVMREFAVFFGREAITSTPDQLQRLTALLVQGCEAGGKLENAISTCLMEHTRQLGVERTLRPWLAQARRGAGG